MADTVSAATGMAVAVMVFSIIGLLVTNGLVTLLPSLNLRIKVR